MVDVDDASAALSRWRKGGFMDMETTLVMLQQSNTESTRMSEATKNVDDDDDAKMGRPSQGRIVHKAQGRSRRTGQLHGGGHRRPTRTVGRYSHLRRG